MGTKELTISKEKIELKEPSKYNVIFHNDDYTTMEFVIDVLVSIYHKTADEAYNLMLLVHKAGKAVIGKYSYDIALTKANITTKRAKENGFPLRVSVEKEG